MRDALIAAITPAANGAFVDVSLSVNERTIVAGPASVRNLWWMGKGVGYVFCTGADGAYALPIEEAVVWLMGNK